MKRTSVVKHIQLNDVGLASALQVGDLVEFKPHTSALAVQRQKAVFLGDEGNLGSFPLFSRPIPQPVVYENVSLNIRNHNPFIHVDHVKVIAISAASLVQIGSTQRIETEARIKHIRQLESK